MVETIGAVLLFLLIGVIFASASEWEDDDEALAAVVFWPLIIVLCLICAIFICLKSSVKGLLSILKNTFG